MFFSGGNELAVHTVASAAFGINSELNSTFGEDEAADVHWSAVLYVVRDHKRGILPSEFTRDAEMMRTVRERSSKYPISSDSTLHDFRPSISWQASKEFWKKRNKIPNSLKHVDRDPNVHLELAEVVNQYLLMQALASYLDLVPEGIGSEEHVLWILSSLNSGRTHDLNELEHRMAIILESLEPRKRLKFCSQYLEELRNQKFGE